MGMSGADPRRVPTAGHLARISDHSETSSLSIPVRGAAIVAQAEMEPMPATSDGIIVDWRLMDRQTGRYMSYEEAYALVAPDDMAAYDARFETIEFGVPGERSRLFVGREVAVYLGLGMLAVAQAAGVTRGRRPY